MLRPPAHARTQAAGVAPGNFHVPSRMGLRGRSIVQTLPIVLEAENGQILPFDSTSLGEVDAFTLWTER